MAQTWRVPRTSRPPLTAAALTELALAYAARYATTRHKLADYLRRKLRERGWAGDDPPPVDDVVDRAAGAGFVDDATFAEQRAGALARRGYGRRRVAVTLMAAGIDADLRASVTETNEDEALATALVLARKRRLGPFGDGAGDPATRRRQLGVLLRAGHDGDVARRILDAPDVDSLIALAAKNA